MTVSNTSGPPLTVLLVEDEGDQRVLLSVQLERAGCAVVAAGTAESGLALLTDDVDLAVVDLRLPGVTGWDLVAAVRARRPDLPVVVTSVLDAESYPAGTHALPKPVTQASLNAALVALAPDRRPR